MRGGRTSTSGLPIYDDAPWLLSSLTGTGTTATVDGMRADLFGWDPMLARALEDNDKALDVSTALSVSAGLQAVGGIDTEFLKLNISVEGRLTGNATQHHIVREEQDVAQRIVLYRAATGKVNERVMMEIGDGPSSQIGKGSEEKSAEFALSRVHFSQGFFFEQVGEESLRQILRRMTL